MFNRTMSFVSVLLLVFFLGPKRMQALNPPQTTPPNSETPRLVKFSPWTKNHHYHHPTSFLDTKKRNGKKDRYLVKGSSPRPFICSWKKVPPTVLFSKIHRFRSFLLHYAGLETVDSMFSVHMIKHDGNCIQVDSHQQWRTQLMVNGCFGGGLIFLRAHRVPQQSPGNYGTQRSKPQGPPNPETLNLPLADVSKPCK